MIPIIVFALSFFARNDFTSEFTISTVKEIQVFYSPPRKRMTKNARAQVRDATDIIAPTHRIRIEKICLPSNLCPRISRLTCTEMISPRGCFTKVRTMTLMNVSFSAFFVRVGPTFFFIIPEPILLLLVAKERNERKTEETKLKL